MKTKAVVILFPEETFLGTRRSCKSLFNECITKRYLNNDYELIVVRYKGYQNAYSGGIIEISQKRIIDADITLNEQSQKYADFEKIAYDIKPKEYDNVVVSGFHCFDYVDKLAKEIFKVNENVVIDTDLTENFDFVSKFYKGWDINKFNPGLKIEDLANSFKCKSPDLIDRIADRYSHPIWGISKQFITNLKSKILKNREIGNKENPNIM